LQDMKKKDRKYQKMDKARKCWTISNKKKDKTGKCSTGSMRKIAGVKSAGLKITGKMTGTENAEKPYGGLKCRITVTVILKVVLSLYVYELFSSFFPYADKAFAFSSL